MKLTLKIPETGAIYDKEHDGFIIIGIDKPKQDPDVDNCDRFDTEIHNVSVWDSLIILAGLIGTIIDSKIKDPKLQQDMVHTLMETIKDSMEFKDSPMYDIVSEAFEGEGKTDE